MSSNNITGLNDTLELLYAYTLKNNFIYSSSLTLFQGFNRLTVQGYAIGGNYTVARSEDTRTTDVSRLALAHVTPNSSLSIP